MELAFVGGRKGPQETGKMMGRGREMGQGPW